MDLIIDRVSAERQTLMAAKSKTRDPQLADAKVTGDARLARKETITKEIGKRQWDWLCQQPPARFAQLSLDDRK